MDRYLLASVTIAYFNLKYITCIHTCIFHPCTHMINLCSQYQSAIFNALLVAIVITGRIFRTSVLANCLELPGLNRAKNSYCGKTASVKGCS